jgi:opacity protein-like surface antigen
MRANTRKQRANPARLILLAALVLAAMLLAGCRAQVAVPEEPEPEPEQNNNGGFRIGYATNSVTAIDDAEAAQAAFDKMLEDAENDRVALSYKNSAYSSDGINFECYIANTNLDDLFVAIYADMELTDELYLSQLLRTGQAFETITLNRKLDPGVHRVYVVHCLVTEEDGEQMITGQATVTMDFHVE